jgi:hypothetical protein
VKKFNHLSSKELMAAPYRVASIAVYSG